MVTTYTTNKRVASLLQYTENDDNGSQVRKDFDANSNPTNEEVDDIIEEEEEMIDEYCETSWKESFVVNEFHDFVSRFNRWGSYVDRAGYRVFPINLKKKFPRTFDTTKGDKIEAWSGTEWKNFLVDHTLGQAMYDNDYYVDYELGKITFFNQFPLVGQKAFRLTYRYGETSVPLGIRRVCTLFASATINERYELYLSVDKDSSPALNQAEKWREIAFKILEDYRIHSIEVI